MVMLVFALCMNGLVAMGVRVQLIDHSAQASRMLGRGEPESAVAQMLAGSSSAVSRDGALVCVQVERAVGILPISARSCALDAGQ